MNNDIKLNIINEAWSPLLGFIITMAVILLDLIYPLFYNIGYFLNIHIMIPESINDNLTSILLGGGVLATIRTIEKKVNKLDKQIEDLSKFRKFILFIRKYWRPMLVYSIIIAVFYLYIIISIEALLLHISDVNKIVPNSLYAHIKDLLITGGFMAGLKTAENALGISNIH